MSSLESVLSGPWGQRAMAARAAAIVKLSLLRPTTGGKPSEIRSSKVEAR